MKKPIIGIILDAAENSENHKYSSSPWYALRQNYVNTIRQFASIAFLIPYQNESVDEIIDQIDGLIIPGCDTDIHPKFYHQNISAARASNDDTKTNFEMKILEKALGKDMPFLGICHGMQLLNVLFGGDLIQDISSQTKIEIDHAQPNIKTPVHSISIKNATILSRLIESNKNSSDFDIMVNSNHRQAVNQPGAGLITSATASDGIIEAIESINHSFVMGVQWHPEYLNNNIIDHAIFKGFIDAVKNKKYL